MHSTLQLVPHCSATTDLPADTHVLVQYVYTRWDVDLVRIDKNTRLLVPFFSSDQALTRPD